METLPNMAASLITPQIRKVCELLSKRYSLNVEECLQVIQTKITDGALDIGQNEDKIADLKPLVPQKTCSSEQQLMFEKIKHELQCDASTQEGQDRIKGWATKEGNTQESERRSIAYVCSVLDKLGLSYEQAGSQQAEDIRNVGGIGLTLEIKKTKNTNICLNDTPPQPHVYYVIFHTTDPRQKATNRKPQVVCCLGVEMMPTEEAERFQAAHETIQNLRNTLGKGEARKHRLTAFPRMNYSFDIRDLLTSAPKPLSVAEMKEELKKLGLSTKGKKQELAERLEQAKVSGQQQS